MASDAGPDANLDSATDANTDTSMPNGCAECAPNARCRFNTCVPDLGSCTTNEDCPGDSYCSDTKECLPYGVPANVTNDPECKREALSPEIVPEIQCAGGANDGQVYTTPVVADLNLDLDPNRLQPSIVYTAWKAVGGARTGVLHVADGRTCESQITFGDNAEDRPAAMTQLAIADLDNDVLTGGHPEIVGFHRVGLDNRSPIHLYALEITVNAGVASLSRKWTGRNCATNEPIVLGTNGYNFAPGVWDLNNDTRPEIVVDSYVFDADGCVLNAGEIVDYIRLGQVSTVADVDLDGKQELILGNRIAEWDEVTTEWIDEDYFDVNRSYRDGHVAVADIGQYSTLPGMPTPNNLPEIIIVSAETNSFDVTSDGTIRVQTLSGEPVFGPMKLRHDTAGEAGHGGPPTAADFDGDGQVEFAAAANEYYAVYDPDCDPALAGASPMQRPGGACVQQAGNPAGVLWSQPSQDRSSSATGSAIFDFNGDGRAEAVYSDECFVRVYDGPTGNVIFSASGTNSTGFEYPTIVDVDGDFSTEIVVPKGPHGNCPARDPIFAGESMSMRESGFAILRDPEDRWAQSRPIWNQHAYSVNNVNDNATIPKSSERQPNWTTPGLNNFRQNTQGRLETLNLADLTVVFDGIDACQINAGRLTLKAKVCNRGTANVQDGARVDFVEAESMDALPGTLVCSTATDRLLEPGECTQINCEGDIQDPEKLFVLVDPMDEIADCHPRNNDGASITSFCLE